MTSEIFQLITDDMPNESTKLRKLISPKFAATIGFLSAGELHQSYGYEYYSSYSTMNSSAFTSFRLFVFSILSNHLSDFFTFHKNFFVFTWFKLIS